MQPRFATLARLALTPFCPIPVDLPHDPAGVDVIPGSGPYAVSSRIVGQRIVLVRNRFYRGPRPHGPSRIVVTVGGTDQSDLAAVESGAADYATDAGGAGGVSIDPETLHRMVERYGINHGQFFFEPTLQVNYFALNTRHGIFAGNPSLRRAVNFAVDRHALAATFEFLGVRRIDQLLPPGVPGFIDAHIYPLRGPDLGRARALARGHLRSGKAVMYARDSPRNHLLGEILAFDLAKIGIHLNVEYFPGAIAYQKAQSSSRGFDIIPVGWLANYDDPDFYLPPFLAGDNAPPNGLNSNFSYFDDPVVNRELAAATQLPAPTRYAAFGKLDVQIVRDQHRSCRTRIAPPTSWWRSGSVASCTTRSSNSITRPCAQSARADVAQRGSGPSGGAARRLKSWAGSIPAELRAVAFPPFRDASCVSRLQIDGQ